MVQRNEDVEGAFGSRDKASIKDVARAAGVSAATVSLVLNGKGRISARTRDQVEQAARALGFILNRKASQLRSGKSALIGLITSDISNPFYAEFSAEAERVLADDGLLPVIANTGDDLQRQMRSLEIMLGEGVAGFIISAADGSTPRSFELLRRFGVPYVLCVRDIGDDHVDFIGFDNVRAGRIAGQHLAKAGHKNAAFIGGVSTHLNFQQRCQGVLQGLGPDGDLRTYEGLPNRKTGQEATRRFHGERGDTTALICFNDLVAAGAYSSLSAQGLAIGSDIAVVGFDNIPETSVWTPPLTTVELYPRGLGARAAQAILAKLNGSVVATPESVFMTPKLVVRQSTQIVL
jgi:DNA-binding LacI/PurR family transcriptional regulator